MSNYSFTEEQAEAIVMLQLYRLTNTDIFALVDLILAKDWSKAMSLINEILQKEHFFTF